MKIRQHHSNRDFFTKPGRKGISFQSLISKISIGEDINNILPITTFVATNNPDVDNFTGTLTDLCWGIQQKRTTLQSCGY
jgi:hypothetical protein